MGRGGGAEEGGQRDVAEEQVKGTEVGEIEGLVFFLVFFWGWGNRDLSSALV